MSDVLEIIRRIRKAEEDAARQELVKAESARDVSEAVLNAMTDAMVRAQESVDGTNPALMAQQHSYLLRLEMNRRALVHEKARRESIVDDRRSRLKSAALETKSIENVVEARDEREALEESRKQQGQLDEFGSMGWWRNTA